MSEKIYKAISDEFARRMRNWVKAGPVGERCSGSISSVYSLGVRVDRYVSVAPPVINGDAYDIDAALIEVPGRYGQAVRQFWEREGLSLREHARQIRHDPPLKYETFERWVIEGHKILEPALWRRLGVTRSIGAQNAATSCA